MSAVVSWVMSCSARLTLVSLLGLVATIVALYCMVQWKRALLGWGADVVAHAEDQAAIHKALQYFAAGGPLAREAGVATLRSASHRARGATPPAGPAAHRIDDGAEP